MLSNSSRNGSKASSYIAQAPAPVAPATQQTAAVSQSVAHEWGNKEALSAGGWFKLRLTLAIKGKGQVVGTNLSNVGNGTGGSICGVHNGFLRWSTKYSQTAKLIAWPAIVPLKRNGFEYSFDEDGNPIFDKSSGLHIFWAAPAQSLEGEDQEVLNKINLWSATGDMGHIEGIELSRIREVMAKAKNQASPQARKLNAYAFLQSLQKLKGEAAPNYARLQVALPEGATEQILEWIGEAAAEGQSGVLDIYIKDRLSMRKETVKPYKFNNESGELVELTTPEGDIINEFQYNWGNPLFVKWNPGESLWEADESRMFSVDESRRIAEDSAKANEKAINRGGEIENLPELVGDLLSTARGNKWMLRVGVLPYRQGESCTLWDDLDRWGDEALDIWEAQLTRFLGKLKKPHGWENEGADMFSQEHLDAILETAKVRDSQVWVTLSGSKKGASAPTPTPAVAPVVAPSPAAPEPKVQAPVVEQVVTPEPAPAPSTAPSSANLLNDMFGGMDGLFSEEDDDGGNY